MTYLKALIPVLLIASFSLSCGSGNSSSRQLRSITITQTTSAEGIEFVAAGNFSSSPATVAPIPVQWSVQLLAPPPPQYALTTQPFVFNCEVVGLTSSGPVPIVAYAPSNPNAALTGAWSISGMIHASVVITCP
jgi:hypothetical protein